MLLKSRVLVHKVREDELNEHKSVRNKPDNFIFFLYYENNLDYTVPIDKKMSETFVLQNLPFRLEE